MFVLCFVFFVYFSWLSGCQYQRNQFPGQTRVVNNLLGTTGTLYYTHSLFYSCTSSGAKGSIAAGLVIKPHGTVFIAPLRHAATVAHQLLLPPGDHHDLVTS